VKRGDQVSLLTGQTAVVTGGAQGLGLAIAERFIAEGARVVLGDLDLGATEAAAEQLGGQDVALAGARINPLHALVIVPIPLRCRCTHPAIHAFLDSVDTKNGQRVSSAPLDG